MSCQYQFQNGVAVIAFLRNAILKIKAVQQKGLASDI